MMKRFIPTVKNDVYVVDSNGIRKYLECSTKEECCRLCAVFNVGEKDDRTKSKNRHNQVSG